jgi:hypothetical protein
MPAYRGRSSVSKPHADSPVVAEAPGLAGGPKAPKKPYELRCFSHRVGGNVEGLRSLAGRKGFALGPDGLRRAHARLI